MNKKQRIARRIAVGRWLHDKNLIRFIPWRFLKQYVYPLTVRGRKKPYEAVEFFESYYGLVSDEEFSDRITMGPRMNPLHAKYHYNSTENSIIRALLRCQLKPNPAVFDLGSGAGHWIDFYRSTFDASCVSGLEISKTCADRLREKYEQTDRVSIVDGDITEPSFRLDQTFDIVNAIGVVFHIVDDQLWQHALVNMRRLLNENGVIVVGGQFGLITQNVQFHAKDQFEEFEDLILAPTEGEIRINKRTRSLRKWKKAAKEAALRVKHRIRTPLANEMLTPENNIIVLERRSKATSAAND